MIIGALYCELHIFDAQSLKEKRSVLKSLLTRIKQRYNVSVAETGHQQLWQRAEIGIVTVSGEKQVAQKELERVLTFIDGMDGLERIVTQYEWL